MQELLKSVLAAAPMDTIASELGISKQDAQKGLGALLPALTGAAQQKIRQEGGLGALVSDNVATLNGRNGIKTFAATNVVRNTASTNGQSGSGYALDLGPIPAGSSYHDNVINSPISATRGTITGFATDAGGNVCNGSLTCP